ncbi:hypothetical protein ACFLZY_02215, partial [Patescibacteria group bacterium]
HIIAQESHGVVGVREDKTKKEIVAAAITIKKITTTIKTDFKAPPLSAEDRPGVDDNGIIGALGTDRGSGCV